MSFRLAVAGGPGFDRLAADLKRAKGQLRPKLTEQLRKPTKAIHDDVRSRILNAQLPARRARGTHRFVEVIPSKGLRRPTANALEWKVTTSAAGPRATITFYPNKVPARIRGLVPYWLGQKQRLRHPIMGHRKGSWVSQTIPNVWEPAKALLPEAQKAAARAVDEVADIIAGRG
jgi:hypothetical protein